MTGYVLLAAAAAVTAVTGFLLRSEYEKRHFVTEEYRIYSDKIKKKERNFVFLSDLHSYTFGEANKKLIEAIDRIKPDAVLIGGDMMIAREKEDPGVVLKLVKDLAISYPVYYGNGNHEQRMNERAEGGSGCREDFKKKLSALGVHYLPDESAGLFDDIRITGCDLDERYYRHRFTVPELPPDEIVEHVGKADPERFQILLLHSPLFFESSKKWGADLTLSGHFHGGTIRLPFLGGIMTPQYQFFLPCCAGRFDKDGKTMIVSRGLGTHSINIRINDKPQLIHLRLLGTTEGRKRIERERIFGGR